jgi:hypothetical protein
MAALNSQLVSLFDVAKSKNKQIGKIAEVLVQENPILKDIGYQVCNEKTYHVVDIRSGLPSVYYRKANQAIAPSKTATEERKFTPTPIESKSVMDELVAARGGADRIPYNRWNQAQGHLQAMANEHASLMFYGSPADDYRKVAGLADIYSTLATTEPTYHQIIDAGGAGNDLTSIYCVHWGERAFHGIYPDGSQIGVKRVDRSPGNSKVQITGTTESGGTGTFYGYEEDFMLDHGLVPVDYRQGGRIANIDISDLAGGSGADVIQMLIQLHYRIHANGNGNGILYCNKTMGAYLHILARNAVGAGGGFTFGNYQGEEVTMFLGKPIRICDAILSTEDEVTT